MMPMCVLQDSVLTAPAQCVCVLCSQSHTELVMHMCACASGPSRACTCSSVRAASICLTCAMVICWCSVPAGPKPGSRMRVHMRAVVRGPVLCGAVWCVGGVVL